MKQLPIMLNFLLIVTAAYLFATKQQGEIALHRTEPSYRAQPCGYCALRRAGASRAYSACRSGSA